MGTGDSVTQRSSELLGPGLRSIPETLSSCNPGSESDANFQFHLVHRSNSLSSDGNTSPTSVMGSHHSVSNSSPLPVSSSSNLHDVSDEWNELEVPGTVFELSNKPNNTGESVPALLSLRHRKGITSPVSYKDVRIKRKLGLGGVYDDGPNSSISLDRVGGNMWAQTCTSSSAPIHDTIKIESHFFSSSSRKESTITKKDVNTWNDKGAGCGEEEDHGPKDEYISSRRRRRLNLIVPNPRKPRQADYMCSLCMEMYQVVVGDNPWWAVYSQQCPVCKQQQVPRIDINSASNAIELDPNVMALYGEGLEDSGDDDCEGGSEEEDEAEKVDDDEAVAAAAAEADQEDLRRDVHPFDGEGLLAVEEASKLLVLMCHARSCTGQHASPKHAEICKVWYSSSSPRIPSLETARFTLTFNSYFPLFCNAEY